MPKSSYGPQMLKLADMTGSYLINSDCSSRTITDYQVNETCWGGRGEENEEPVFTREPVMTPSVCQLHMLDKTDAGKLLSLLPSCRFLFIKPSTVATD